MSRELSASQNYVWNNLSLLGQGATSKVYKGRNKNNGDEVAVKVFTASGRMRSWDVQNREFTVMRKLHHPNIVSLLAIEEEQVTGNKVIVMELSTCGSLWSLLDDPVNSFGLGEEEFLWVVTHVAAGMRHLRESDIVHRDIKPGNILRYKGEDGRSIYKLTDFGAAKELDHEEEQFYSLYGTEEYLHPDIYGKAVMRARDIGGFSATVDLWSLGVTFYHAATGQLPFRPYGGRRNRETMYEITRKKESGIISGVQRAENGKIEWSRDLPSTCLLSVGLKKQFTPVLALLLESDEKKKWNFDGFFRAVEAIVSKNVINVFSPVTWSNMKIYIDKNQKLTRLQELIAEQCEIAATNQLLIFERELFEVQVDPLTPIRDYPTSISENNPILVFMKSYPDHKYFPRISYPEFPRFGGQVNISNDYQLAKTCCAIMHFQLHSIQRYHINAKLIRLSVHSYIQELHHEITHLVDYSKHQKEHCDTCRLWTRHFNMLVKQNLQVLKMCDQQSEMNSRERVETDMTDYKNQLESSEKQVYNLSQTASIELRSLEKEEFSHRTLDKMWRDNIGCCPEKDRCCEKVEVMLETMTRIVRRFKEHRAHPILDANEQSLHTFEKNKLSVLCSTSQSMMENCYKNAEKQYNAFYKWFSQAVDTRRKSDKINMLLGQLEKSQSELIKYLEAISENSFKAMEAILEEHQTSPYVSFKASSSSSSGSKEPSFKSFIQSLNDNMKSLSEECKDLQSKVYNNSETLTSTEKHIKQSGVNVLP